MSGTLSQPKTIKSAERTLRVLEYFALNRSPATVSQIVRACDLPQSSTSELLWCLTSLGYLAYDSGRRNFRPTARVALLGARMMPSLFRHGAFFTMMDELHSETGEVVIAGLPVGPSVCCAHILPSVKPNRIEVPQGLQRPLLHSAMGRVLLSGIPEEKLESLVNRLNAVEQPHRRVKFDEFREELVKIRVQGYAVTFNQLASGGGVVAVRLPVVDGQELAVGIVSRTDIIAQRKDYFATLLKRTVRQFTLEAEALAEQTTKIQDLPSPQSEPYSPIN